MTHTQTFIDSFIEGTDDLEYRFYDLNGSLGVRKGEDFFDIHWLLLKPFVWQAVGKVKGWDEKITRRGYHAEAWKEVWHRFIDFLADGKSYDEALGEILK